LDNHEYQQQRDELVDLFIGLKYKIKIEDLTFYEPIFTSNIQKVNVLFVKNLLIFIVLTVVIMMSGYALTIGGSIKQIIINYKIE
jgi:hypothetical protein